MKNIPEDIFDLILDDLCGELQSEDQQKLQDWLNESAENRNAYIQFSSLWYSGIIAGKDSKDDEITFNKIEQRHKGNKKHPIFFWMVSIAASMILLLGIYQGFRKVEVTTPEYTTIADLSASREISKVKLILSSGREVVLDGKVVEKDGDASIHSDSTGIAYIPVTHQNLVKELAYNELIVPKCGEFKLTLADGTTVMLNAESKLRFPVHFSEQTREVWLSGEAYFDVVKNEKQPFIVHVDNVAVKVLGTSFNVMSYQDSENTEITLVQGRVEVGAAGKKELLIPGHQVVVEHSTLRMKNREVDVEPYIAWTKGILYFDDMSLYELTVRLSRWYDIHFEFSREELKSRLFSGGFRKYESIERVLEMIQETNDIQFRVQNNKVIVDKK